jgi:transcriptional regulator with XRE-family HTH domain
MGGLGMKKYRNSDSPPCDEPILYRGAGLEGIYLCNGFVREEIDGEWFTYIEDIEGLHNAIALDLVALEDSLSGKEIRFIRNTMGKTQEEVAESLGVDAQTVARWEKGKTKIPGPADKFLRVMFLASIVGPDAILDYISEVERLHRIEAKRDKVIFARDEAKDAWIKPNDNMVLESA